jgi:hypothetical protein
MCYSDPRKSLALARERLTPEQWAKFEREFDDFCVVQGLADARGVGVAAFDWAKWAFYCARPRPEPALTAQCIAANRLADSYPQLPYTKRALAAHYERIAIAMMTDEQAEASLERWRGVKGEEE